MRHDFSFISLCGFVALAYLTAATVSAGSVGLERLSAAIHDSDYFAVVPEQVSVEGTSRLGRPEILLLAGLDRRMSWFDINEHRVELFIRTSGWIKRCAVNAVFPNRVRIFIEEYEPAIVIYRPETRGERGEALYTMWFADREGTVFKKAFPGEHSGDLPLFFVENGATPGRQREAIKRALEIADEWKKHRSLCVLRGITYDAIEGFSLECEFSRRQRATVRLGEVEGRDAVTHRGELFRRAANGLLAKGLFAGEYLFKARGGDTMLVAGKLVQQKD